MGNIAIQAENLGKQYRIGTLRNKQNFREAIIGSVKNQLRHVAQLFYKNAGDTNEAGRTIWALKDVSFQINFGDRLGIIGRNGSGKSTLLKILSRITEPTTGFAQIQGRVRSMLEVGTGFHHELTGRENIFLNGAILGMKKDEIRKRFDEIVAFSEVEKFIDTPVKHYSSGMYMRLAFAVAAHLESEILIVDEVLSVGDNKFQNKCLNKMQEVGEQGRTVLFVSHSIPAVTRLCNKAILLDEGRLLEEGPATKIAKTYFSKGLNYLPAERLWQNADSVPGGEIVRLYAVRVKAENGEIAEQVKINRAVEIEMEYNVIKGGYILMPHFHLFNQEGTKIFITLDIDAEWRKRPRPEGRYTSRVLIPGNFLQEGLHIVWSALITLEPMIVQFFEKDAVMFQVVENADADTARGDYARNIDGAVRPLLKWTTSYDAIKH